MLCSSKLLVFVTNIFAICGASPTSVQQSTCAAEGGICDTSDNPSFIQKPLAKHVSLSASQGNSSLGDHEPPPEDFDVINGIICGYGDNCGYAYIGKNGERWDYATKETAKRICGKTCAAHGECKAFNYLDHAGKCYYRKDGQCGRSAEPRATCYMKAECTHDLCTKVDLTKTDPQARCNDNTKAFFYYAPAKDPASKTWFIYQRGGDWCYDQKSCSGRDSELMSSATWSSIASFPRGSFLNYDGSAQAHRVYLPYCTSDGYIGNYTAGPMQFRGRVVTQALYETLHLKYGLGEGATVVHGGCSAGGRGVMHNANHVLKQLKSYGEIRYIPVMDSVLYVRAHGGLSENGMAKNIYKRTPKSVDPDCKRIYKPKQWRCLIAEFALPTVDTTFVMQAYLFDLFQTSWKSRGCSGGPKDSYCTWFQAHTRRLAREFEKAGNAVLAPACSAHCSIQSAAFSEFKTGGVSFAAVVDEALRGTTRSAIDSCALPQCDLGFAGEGSLHRDKCKQTETAEMHEDVYGSSDVCSLQSTGREGRQFGSGFVCGAD